MKKLLTPCEANGRVMHMLYIYSFGTVKRELYLDFSMQDGNSEEDNSSSYI